MQSMNSLSADSSRVLMLTMDSWMSLERLKSANSFISFPTSWQQRMTMSAISRASGRMAVTRL